MYYPVNNFGNCIIFNKPLIQDLENYSLEWSTSNNLHLLYNTETIVDSNKIDFKINKLISLIAADSSSTIDQEQHIWRPLLIKVSDISDSVGYAPVIDKITSDNPIYGIDKIFSFNPKFKNWDIENLTAEQPAKMICNWHINSIFGSSLLDYGVLCWYKYTDYGQALSINFKDLFNNAKFCFNSDVTYRKNNEIITIKANTLLYKFNNEYIKLPNNSNAIITSNTNTSARSNPVLFNTEQVLLKASDIIESQLLNNCIPYQTNKFIANDKTIELYISNGESFSYYDGIADKIRNNYHKNPSRTYLSPSLHKIYREIYHRLTIRSKKSLEASMSRRSARLFQKLCYTLSTAPLIDRTTVDILSDVDIYRETQNYILSQTNDQNEEITNLKNILKFIYNKYKPLATYRTKQTIQNNYISNEKDIFKCLLNKYSANLWIEGHSKLKYKSVLENGPHAFVSTQSFSWKPIVGENASKSIFYNNSYINIGNIFYSTNFSNNSSLIQITASGLETQDITEIPLADISITKIKPPYFYLGTGIYKSPDERVGDEIVFRTDIREMFGFDPFGGDNGSIVATDTKVTYSFEQASGPNFLRFDDLSRDRSGFNRYKKVTKFIEGPSVFIKETGTYDIKCTRSHYGIIESDTFTITTDSNYNPEPLFSIPANASINATFITSNIKSIAFNKRGMVWIVDSEHYIDIDDFNVMDDIGIPGIIKMKDIKVDLNKKPITLLQTDASLDIGFNATEGHCPISINSINLENLRDKDYKYSQCKSFYREKTKRVRSRFRPSDFPTFGASDFYRESESQYTLTYYDRNGKQKEDNTTAIKKVSLLTSTGGVSTSFAPPILSYGGYPKNIVDKIGITLPSHPQPRESGGFIPSDSDFVQKSLPMIDRVGLSNDNSNPIVCYLKEIPIGENLSMEFNKGHFHPISGWISAATMDNAQLNGKSNVITDKPHLQNSYLFKGIGFSSLDNITSNDHYQSTISIQPETFDTAASSYDRRYGYDNKNIGFNSWYSSFYIEDNADTWSQGLSGDSIITYSLKGDLVEKTIDGIDINLKFLNHFNPKNLLIWLEITHNSQAPKAPDYQDSTIFIDNNKSNHEITSTKFKKYIADLHSSNSSDPVDKYKIFLINQEHLDNYNQNFSITFTDQADKNIFTHNASYVSKQDGFNNNILKNSNSINPTLRATKGYDDIELESFSNAIKTNQINITNNTLNKCKDLKLIGSSFKLCIKNLEPIEHSNRILDNLNNNTFITTDNKNISTLLFDNLCSWSVRIHTSEKKEAVDADLLGYIDYDVISDLTTKKNIQFDKIAIGKKFNAIYKYQKKETSETINITIIYKKTTEALESTAQDQINSVSYKLFTDQNRELTDKGFTINKISFTLYSQTISPYSNYFSDVQYFGKYAPKNTGYNFICDFKDKNFLIPLVNVNAPYKYLANISECYYDDPDIPRTISYSPPEFPSLLGYQLAILGAVGLSSLGITGSLTALSILTQTFSQGGRSDPIVGYFLANRDFEITMANNSQFFKPVYNEKTHGISHKAIVSFSIDGAIWYNTEVPIFKYSNTPTIHKNIYSYIKLNKFAPEILSVFSFKVVKSIQDLDIANCIVTISADITTTTGLVVAGYNLKDGDIILITGQKEENKDKNGYWEIHEDNWIKVPCFNCDAISFLAYNNIGKLLNSNLYNEATISQNIIIDGIRAYNFFDIGETITFKEPENTIATILDKSIISTMNGQKTILTLSQNIEKDSSIFKTSGHDNVIFLYKDDISVQSSDNIFPLNQWSVDSSESYRIKKQTPETRISCIGEGSIGWGTDTIFPTPLSFIELENNKNLYSDIFTNTNNDHYRLEKITILDKEDVVTNIINGHDSSPNNKIKASSYSYDSFGVSFNDITQEYSTDKNTNILYKYIYSNSISDKKNKVFIDLKSDQFLNIPDSGSIIIEKDYLFSKTIKFKNEDINKLIERLRSLLSIDNNFQPEQITDIYDINSIDNLTKYYNFLQADSLLCNQTNRSTVLLCPKLLAKKRLAELHREKYDIEIALSVNQGSIELPHVSGKLIDNLPTGLNIEYIPNNDLYWIHIDPNQRCSINDELTVKILTETSVVTLPISTNIGGGGIFADNVITLSPTIGNQIEQNTNNNPQTEVYYDFRGDRHVIKTAPSVIEDQKIQLKTKYPSIDWSNTEEFVYGDNISPRANSKKYIVSDGKDKDYIIIYTEKYIRPAGFSTGNQTIKDVIDLDSQNQLKIQFRNLTRKIKSIDSENFVRYGYDTNGNLVRDIFGPASVGQIANNFVCWHCINSSGVHVTGIPPFLMAANEMRYRAFFGSIDGVEHKNTNISDSLEDWEWIPFEYFK